MLTPRLLVLLGASACLPLAACGDDPGPVGGDADGGTVQPPPDAATGACTAGQTQSCSCGGSTYGTQSCYSGSWLLCNCNSYDAGQAPITGGSCVAGRYEGSFKGEYRSGFAFGFGIDVEAQDFSGRPGLAFTLNEQTTGCGAEFCDYSISDGYVKGTANGVFPFEGTLTGKLNCATKTFEGELVGCYAIGFNAGFNVGNFSGPVKGTYDGNTHEFTIGTWDVLEKDVVTGFFGMVGGNGSWNAKHNPMPSDTSPVGAPNCSGGMITPAPDAGTP